MKKHLFSVLFFVLTGCFSTHKDTSTFLPKSLDRNWSLAGKVSVKYNSEGFVSRFMWRQDRDGREILFKYPIGNYVKVTMRKDMCILETSSGTIVMDDSLESLMVRELGWFFPLDKVASWVDGFLHSSDNVKNRSQDGWYMSVEEFFSSNQLPRKLYFSSEETEIKLIVKEWNFINGKIE